MIVENASVVAAIVVVETHATMNVTIGDAWVVANLFFFILNVFVCIFIIFCKFLELMCWFHMNFYVNITLFKSVTICPKFRGLFLKSPKNKWVFF